MIKKGEEYLGLVDHLEFPNKGIVYIDGNKVIVKYALPGQQVRFVISKSRKGRYEGRLKEVVADSPLQRADGVCPHFGICGGCLFQNFPYEEQLRIKEDQIKGMLSPFLGQAEDFEGILASPRVTAYRNKMEFSFGDEYLEGPLALGMHRRGSFYDIETVSGCRIVDEDYRRILNSVLDYFTERGIPFYKKLRHQGYLRHLLIRKGVKTEEILVVLVTSSDFFKEVELGLVEEELLLGMVDCLKAVSLVGKLAGVLHTVNDSLADVVQSDRTDILYGRDFFYEELLGLTFKITPFSFFQTNSLGAEVLYSVVRDYIGDTRDKVVFDLYSGTGTIAQILAAVAEKVVGVEIVEEAVRAAEENAKENGLSNCEFIAGDVLKVLDQIEDKPDLIVLDPPRDGIHPKALPKILDYGVERIVYVSCKPTSLVRDLQVFADGGYEVMRCRAVDLFPSTGHVETVVLLSKLKTAKSIEVEINLDEMDLTKAESKATYAEIKQYVVDNAGFKVSQLYVAQVKRKHGLIERINYNVGDGKSKVPQVPIEKEKAIEDALRYFKMI